MTSSSAKIDFQLANANNARDSPNDAYTRITSDVVVFRF